MRYWVVVAWMASAGMAGCVETPSDLVDRGICSVQDGNEEMVTLDCDEVRGQGHASMRLKACPYQPYVQIKAFHGPGNLSIEVEQGGEVTYYEVLAPGEQGPSGYDRYVLASAHADLTVRTTPDFRGSFEVTLRCPSGWYTGD